jgi:hypothetical protein
MHQLVEILQEWKINLITSHADQFVAAAENAKVSTTRNSKELNWQIELAAYAATWWLQNPSKPYEAFTTAIFNYLKA